MIPDLTIITVNLNNSEGLKDTIQSVVNQVHKNFEYIIVDGCSTDGSIDVIRQHENSVTKWISEPDSGVYQAMNKGIQLASGEYLLFMNSGDCFTSENVISMVFQSPKTADILCGRSNIWNNGKLIHTTKPPEYHTFATYYNATINHQATFIKRTLFEKYGLYREDFKINSDWEFWVRTIILNNCSTEQLDMVITDYKLDGMSSDPKNDSISHAEMDVVLAHPTLARFVPDYKKWDEERRRHIVTNWARSKSYLYIPLLFLYNIARFISGKK